MTDEERRIRMECAKVASAEYEYWRDLPMAKDPAVQAMQIAAMGAASNICARILLPTLVRET